LALFFFSSLCADELTVDPPQFWETPCVPCLPPAPPPCNALDAVVVDLIDPVYEDGVLRTEKGGILAAPGLRIQAQRITYIKKPDAESPICTVQCEGNLLIDYQEWTLAGDSLYYDFHSHQGYLINGRTAAPPWSVGGREILLLANGTLVVVDGFLTTSEGEVQDVAIRSPRICLTPDQIITAKHVNIRVNEIPIFWLPFLELDLNQVDRFPFAVKFGWGGFLGSYLSFLYTFFSWRDFDATARFDIFFGKGIGFGIETAYTPGWRPTRLFTRNYVAHDIALDDPKKRDRYRFQGTYFDKFADIVVEGMYDFVSDAEMAADYTNKDFSLPTAGRTQIDFRHKNALWIADLFARIRVNKFQNVNQELPSFLLNIHPFRIPCTGILFENTFKVSYLDYVFSEDVHLAKDFSSGRVSVHPFAYRPFFFGPVALTPEAGFIGIAYSKSPDGGGSVGNALGEFGLKMESAFSRCTPSWKHVVEPYLHYTYLTPPIASPDRHYIFTINDGWDRLNMLRFGVRNSFFLKSNALFVRPLWSDLWANAFFNTPTLSQSIPRAYLNVEWMPFSRLFIGSESAWLFEHQCLDFYNVHMDFTVNENLAFGIEYRYRSSFDWRKADFYNFILDSVRSKDELLASPLSDQRETVLFRIFARPTPSWTAKLDLRHGKHTKQRRSYFEYQLELSRIIFQHWKFTFLYEKKESDTRYSFSLLLNPCPPP
jgi:hypothetical protein